MTKQFVKFAVCIFVFVLLLYAMCIVAGVNITNGNFEGIQLFFKVLGL